MASITSAQAQQSPAPRTATNDDVVELSPFVLTESKDEGYAPSETLSGTRLKSQVKDVPSAITILSADMLADLGARDFTDALDFLPSTARYQSNEGDPHNNGQRTGTPFTVRGFRSDSLTTNFFGTQIAVDTYNTTRLTFTRGPNSIVFGVGNPGGALDIVTNRPELRRTFHSVSLRADDFGGYRINTDSNITLIRDKLGIRIDALQDDRRRYIEPTHNRRSAIYGAATYRPFSQTTVTTNGELYRMRGRPGRSVVAYDQVTPWLMAGSPIKPVYGNTAAVNGLEYNNANSHPVIIEGESTIGPMNWKSSAFGARHRINGVLNNIVSFSTPSVVPLNVNISGDGDDVAVEAKSASLFVQQAVGKRLFFELAGKYEFQYSYNFEGLGGVDNAVRVDANAQLPNGQPNANVGVPYLETINAFYVKRWTETGQGRLTASYEADLGRWRPWGRSLGKLTFAALVQNDRSHQRLDNWREVNETPLVTTGAFGRLDNGVNGIRRRYYLRPGLDPWLKTQWAPVDANGIRTGWERVRATPRDNVTKTSAYAASAQADLLENRVVITGGARRETVKQTQGVYTRDERGVFPGVGGPSSTLADRSIGETYSAGLVLNLTRQVAVFINRANNFVPSNQSATNIFGAPAAPIEGEGYDAGIRVSLLGGKLQGSAGKFSTEQRNVGDGAQPIGNIKTGITAIWNAIDLDRVPNAQWTDFRTTRTEGYELQLVGNPTQQLRLMVTASRNRTILADRSVALRAYVAANRSEWAANSALPSTSNLAPTVGGLLTRVETDLTNAVREIGRRQTRNSEWQVSTMARYRFAPESWLKGFAIGTASFWRDEPIIGYRAVAGTALVDTTQPFYGAKTLNVDAWIDYARSNPRRKFGWETQFRVQNLLDDRTAKPWTALDDGTGGRFVEQRLFPNSIGFSLSTKFSF